MTNTLKTERDRLNDYATLGKALDALLVNARELLDRWAELDIESYSYLHGNYTGVANSHRRQQWRLSALVAHFPEFRRHLDFTPRGIGSFTDLAENLARVHEQYEAQEDAHV